MKEAFNAAGFEGDGLPAVAPEFWVKLWAFEHYWFVASGDGNIRIMNNDLDKTQDEAMATAHEHLCLLNSPEFMASQNRPAKGANE